MAKRRKPTKKIIDLEKELAKSGLEKIAKMSLGSFSEMEATWARKIFLPGRVKGSVYGSDSKRFSTLQRNIKIFQSKIENLLDEKNAQEDFTSKKEKELLVAKEELERATRAYEKANDAFVASQICSKVLEEKYEQACNLQETNQKMLENISKILIVHPSATITTLSDYADSKMLCSWVDAQVLDYIDPCVINPEEITDTFVDAEKYYMEGKSDEEKSSIIEFCNIVLNYKLHSTNPDEIVPVYADKWIDKILKENWN